MPRQKKDAHAMTLRLDSHIVEQLEQFCEESGQTKTTAIERILGRYFKEYFSRHKEERIIN
jgi:predicted transcriptional regulator